MSDIQTIAQLLKTQRESLLTKSNVVATGIGYKISKGKKTADLSVICSVKEKVAASKLSTRDMVPQTLDGIATDVIATGPIRALLSPTDRHRPAPGGVSIGHRDITAGTLGCLVKQNGQIMILSNNHVLANSNDANTGDAILQPGPHDGGTYPDDHIANLAGYVPINFLDSPSQCPLAIGSANVLNGIAKLLGSDARLHAVSTQATDNLVDAAIARPLNDADVSSEILSIGPIAGTAQAELGMAVKKSGRTTAFTTGEIQQIDVTVNVQYGAGKVARFTDQLMAGAMSQGGDSGSAVLNNDDRLVGLLFAGSDQSTIISRIGHVFSALNLTL